MRSIRFGLALTFVGLLAACGGGAAAGGGAKGADDAAAAGAGESKLSGDWSLEDKETWTGYAKEAKEWADDASTKCGIKVSGAWNPESFRGHMPNKSPYARQSCEAGFTALVDICRQGDLQKTTVAKKFNGGSVECKYTATKGGSIEVTGNKLVVLIDDDGGTAGGSGVTDVVKGKL